jgi:hypothetical protein
MADKVPFSTHGLAPSACIDVDSLSTRARRYVEMRPVVIATASGQKQTAVFTQNSTVKHELGPVGQVATLKAAYVSQGTLGAGGALTLKLVAYDASGNAEIILTETVNPESGTVREAQAFTLATTNVELAADDTLELHAAADNAAVTQDAQAVRVTLVWEPSEEATPTIP